MAADHDFTIRDRMTQSGNNTSRHRVINPQILSEIGAVLGLQSRRPGLHQQAGSDTHTCASVCIPRGTHGSDEADGGCSCGDHHGAAGGRGGYAAAGNRRAGRGVSVGRAHRAPHGRCIGAAAERSQPPLATLRDARRTLRGVRLGRHQPRSLGRAVGDLPPRSDDGPDRAPLRHDGLRRGHQRRRPSHGLRPLCRLVPP